MRVAIISFSPSGQGSNNVTLLELPEGERQCALRAFDHDCFNKQTFCGYLLCLVLDYMVSYCLASSPHFAKVVLRHTHSYLRMCVRSCFFHVHVFAHERCQRTPISLLTRCRFAASQYGTCLAKAHLSTLQQLAGWIRAHSTTTRSCSRRERVGLSFSGCHSQTPTAEATPLSQCPQR